MNYFFLNRAGNCFFLSYILSRTLAVFAVDSFWFAW